MGDSEAPARKHALDDDITTIVIIVALLVGSTFTILYGATAFTAGSMVLRWTASLLLMALLAWAVRLLVVFLRAEARRADTVTQAIRSASQGQAELLGQVVPLDGPLIAPLFGAPCIHYVSTVSVKESDPLVRPKRPYQFLMEVSHKTPQGAAYLLTDGDPEGRQVFIPADEETSGLGDYRSASILPEDTLCPVLRERIGPVQGRAVSCKEFAVPVGRTVLVNGVFKTLSSADSYLRAQAERLGQAPPDAERLEASPLEAAWRAHCRRREEAAGTAPVPVDVMLPLSSLDGLPVTKDLVRGTSYVVIWVMYWAAIVVPSVLVLVGWVGLGPPIFGRS